MSSIFDGIGDDGIEQLDENLRKWFKEKWVRFGPDGKIRGACARGSDKEGKPKCLPQSKAHSIGKKGRKYAASKKRREDPNPERRGPAKNVATKKKTNEGIPFNQCPECLGPIVHESMLNEKQDACYHKVKARYKVWPSAYASGALVQCRKKGAKNWGNKSKANENNIFKGMVDEQQEVSVLYIDGKPSTKYARDHEAKSDLERMKAKFPSKKFELKREMREGEVVPFKKKTDKDKYNTAITKQRGPLPISYIDPNSAITGKSIKPGDPIEIPDEYQDINLKSKIRGVPKQNQTNFEVWGNDHGYYVFGNNTNAVLSAWPNGEMMVLSDPSNSNGRESCQRFAKQAMKPVELDSLSPKLKNKILQKMSMIDQPMNEGVIVGHDANDPDVAILGGAGTYKLSNVKKKAQMEANELAKDIMDGKFKNSAYNIKQLANTLNTIVAAEEEMEKKYFGEDYTGEFAAEVTPAINPYGGLKDKRVRGAIGEALLSETPTDNPTGASGEGGWRKYKPKPAGEIDEDTAYAGGMGQGGYAGQSYRKFKPKSAGTFKEEHVPSNMLVKKFFADFPRAKDAVRDAMYNHEYASDAVDYISKFVTPKMSNIEFSKIRPHLIDYFKGIGLNEEELDEACWKGYHKEGNKKMFGKTYPNCVKNTNEEEQLDEKCWDSHKQVGMKKKGEKMVPNCVPKESAIMKGLTGKRR